MRHSILIAAMLASLVRIAAAQPGAKVTIPPHSHQSREFPFANICPAVETFKVATEPETDWLRSEPAIIDVQPGATFIVRLTANSGNHAPGTYRAAVKLMCVSCAASNPPCFQSATEFPVQLTVANVEFPGEFEPITAASPSAAYPLTAGESTTRSHPAPYVPPAPRPPAGSGLIAVVGGGLLLVGTGVMVLAILALRSNSKLRPAIGDITAESQRHQVRR